MSTSNPLRVRVALVDRSTAINGLADCAGELGRDPLRARDRRADVMRALINLGAIAHMNKDLAEARRLYQESVTISQGIGDRQNLAVTLSNLGDVLCQQGEYNQAIASLQESIDIKRDLGNPVNGAFSRSPGKGCPQNASIPASPATIC
jgi:tetratricopeptide (TPR) repeat protein